jgi:hypothetical protein
MQFDKERIQNLIAPYHSFSAEGFNIFGIGEDDLPHLICACPDKETARAMCSMLAIAKSAQTLQVTTAEINSSCYLTPMLLADGTLALVASVIDEAVWKDGIEVEYDGLELHLGTPEYETLVSKFLTRQEDRATVLHVYEDTLMQAFDPTDEFPF